MHNYAGDFLIYLARDHQNRILQEAGLAQKLHQAREQSEQRGRGSAFAAWVAGVLGLRSREQILG